MTGLLGLETYFEKRKLHWAIAAPAFGPTVRLSPRARKCSAVNSVASPSETRAQERYPQDGSRRLILLHIFRHP
jgi:hypothetical protein